jgi:hypothetical protein
MCQDRIVGIPTGYGLDDSWIESRWGGVGGGLDFPHPFIPALNSNLPPIQCEEDLFCGGVALNTYPHLPPRLNK